MHACMCACACVYVRVYVCVRLLFACLSFVMTTPFPPAHTHSKSSHIYNSSFLRGKYHGSWLCWEEVMSALLYLLRALWRCQLLLCYWLPLLLYYCTCTDTATPAPACRTSTSSRFLPLFILTLLPHLLHHLLSYLVDCFHISFCIVNCCRYISPIQTFINWLTDWLTDWLSYCMTKCMNDSLAYIVI